MIVQDNGTKSLTGSNCMV